MRAAWTIAKRDIFSFFVSPVAYVILTVWMLVQGLGLYGFASYFAASSYQPGALTHTPLTLFFGGTSLFYLFLIVVSSLLTMRLIAEETRAGTIEPLMTAPVTELALVLGKFGAAMFFWFALWAPTLLYVWLLSHFGDIDPWVVASSYLGLLSIGLYYMGIGLLMSSVTRNQIVAAVLTFLALAFLYVLGVFEDVLGGEAGDVLGYFNVWRHMGDFAKGVVDSRPLVLAVSIGVSTVLMAWGVLGRGRAAARSRAGAEQKGSRAAGQALMGQAPLVLLVAILVMVNYLSFRHHTRWDWTSEGMYTLSDRTNRELALLDVDIDVYLFLSKHEANFPDLEELLARYEAGSDHLKVHYVDPDSNPAEYQLVADRFGVAAGMLESGQAMADLAAVVTAGDRKWKVTRDDLLGFDFGSFDEDEPPKMDVKAEQALTGALVQVTSGRVTKVCIAAGHGEWPLEAGADQSLYTLEEELRRDNIEMEAAELRGQRDIPEHCDALYVVGPTRPFGEEEASRIRSYLDRGGNVLLALDPVLEGGRVAPTGLEEMLGQLGIRVDQNLVLELDPAQLVPPGNPPGPFIVTHFGEHPTTTLLRDRGELLVAMLRSVRPTDGSRAETVLETSGTAWGESDLSALKGGQEPEQDAEDVPGPVSLAVATRVGAPVEEGEAERGGRLVVVGDADWLLTEPLRHPRLSNLDLALSFTGWLTEREALISIPAKKIDAQPMLITEDDLGGLLGRLLLMALSPFLLGVASWWSRRS